MAWRTILTFRIVLLNAGFLMRRNAAAQLATWLFHQPFWLTAMKQMTGHGA